MIMFNNQFIPMVTRRTTTQYNRKYNTELVNSLNTRIHQVCYTVRYIKIVLLIVYLCRIRSKYVLNSFGLFVMQKTSNYMTIGLN